MRSSVSRPFSQLVPMSYADAPEKSGNKNPENPTEKEDQPDWHNPGLAYGAPLGGSSGGRGSGASMFDRMIDYFRRNPVAANAGVCTAASTAWVIYGLSASIVARMLQARGVPFAIEIGSTTMRGGAMATVHLPAETLLRDFFDRHGIAVPTVTPDMTRPEKEFSKGLFTLPFALRTFFGVLGSLSPQAMALLSWPAGALGGIGSGAVLQNADPNALMITNGVVDNNRAIKTDGRFDARKFMIESGDRGVAGMCSAVTHHLVLRTCLKAGMPRPMALFCAVTVGVDIGWLSTRELIAEWQAGGSRPPASESPAPRA